MIFSNFKLIFLSGLFAVTCLHISAQNKIKFIVTDSATNETLTGVNVYLKGTTTGTVTDNNGTAILNNIPSGDQAIAISFVGYRKMELTFSFPLQNPDLAFAVMLPSESEEMEEVTVSATRNNRRIENLPTKIEVLGLEDMTEENGIKPGNIVGIIGDIAGIQMQQTSAASGNLNARIQGLDGRYSQILRDGMPLYGGFSGSFSILQVQPIDLKQIEIIKGSASTLFGGDAIGGIINLVSKDPSGKPETNLLINQTTLRETDVNTYITRKNKNTGFTLFAGTIVQKSVDVNSDGFSETPDLNNLTIHPRVFYYLNSSTTFSAGFNSIYENRKGGDMVAIRHQPNAEHPYYVHHFSNRNSVELSFDKKFDESSVLSFKGSTSLLYRSIETQNYTFTANQNLYFTELSYFLKQEKYDFVFGANFNGDIFRKSTNDSIPISNYNYATTGFFVQNDWRLSDKLLLESGLRYDIHSKMGGFMLPRLSVMYKFLPKLTARLNGGLGYKIPVIFGYINEETDLNRLLANHYKLNAETSQGVNFDINYSAQVFQYISITLNQSFYFTRLDNPVVYKLISNKVELKNASKPIETKGLQSYLRLSYSKIELYISYVYTEAVKKYDPSDPWFLATPKHNLAATLMVYPNKNWQIGLESSFFGPQYIENNETTPIYVFTAGMIKRNFNKLAVVLNCENLLDYRQKHYIIPPVTSPSFKTLWAPIDGRVINLSLNFKLS
jgi:outer membrane receptor for ferrienterochelin and colicins